MNLQKKSGRGRTAKSPTERQKKTAVRKEAIAWVKLLLPLAQEHKSAVRKEALVLLDEMLEWLGQGRAPALIGLN